MYNMMLDTHYAWLNATQLIQFLWCLETTAGYYGPRFPPQKGEHSPHIFPLTFSPMATFCLVITHAIFTAWLARATSTLILC